MWAKLWFAFLSGFFIELWLAAHTYSVTHGLIPTAALVNITYPLVSLVGTVLVVEEKTFNGRLKLALGTGVGYAMGSSVFIKFAPFLRGGAS